VNNKHFAYARVSSAHQSTGLEAQVRALKDYCHRNGIENIKIFQDENQSGTKSSRPALDQMMKEVRNGGASSVIVYSFSRYARSVTHLLQALEEFKAIGVRFISITEQVDTESPLGRALFTILASIAQLERDILAERVRNGLHNAKMKGIKIGRKKTRPSELIRTLRRAGFSYRSISSVAKCSTGAVATELKHWKKELALQSKTIDDEIKSHAADESKTIKAPEEKMTELEIVRY